MDDWVNLTVPKGNERELCSHAEMGFIPWRDCRRGGQGALAGAGAAGNAAASVEGGVCGGGG
jgi:hypothetical protein